MSSHDGPVLAAGGVLWRWATDPRAAGARVEVALVHRPRYDDWSLPKGHVEDGEHRVVTALREIAEETGHQAVLGRHLGRSRYRVAGRPKRVDHWAARATGGSFTPNEEVDELRWLPVEHAAAAVTQRSDAAVLRRFAALPADTETLLLVRHAKAGSRKRFRGEDRLRPLVREGHVQARALVPLCLAFGATVVHAADRVRCEQTVQPLADALDVGVRSEPLLSEEGWAAGPADGARRAQQVLTAGGVPVVCSQGGVIPALVARWAAASGIAVPPGRTRKASTWVVSSVQGEVVALDHLTDPYH
jgi:8-oxo-dGTP pyrophosphatase MutT (NUDIX family)